MPLAVFVASRVLWSAKLCFTWPGNPDLQAALSADPTRMTPKTQRVVSG